MQKLRKSLLFCCASALQELVNWPRGPANISGQSLSVALSTLLLFWGAPNRALSYAAYANYKGAGGGSHRAGSTQRCGTVFCPPRNTRGGSWA